MPTLPDLDYRRVVIHDNFEALYCYAKKTGIDRMASSALMGFNGRFIAFQCRDVALISTGMGSAQTNCLAEALSKKGCLVIVKVGTCSALQDTLCEGDVIVPAGALVDEGSTYWLTVKRQHDEGFFADRTSVRGYIEGKELVKASDVLRKQLVEAAKLGGIRLQNDDGTSTMWSVDSYGCFDGSPDLYSQVNGQTYSVSIFGSESKGDVAILGVEMECSALFAGASNAGIEAASLIVVSRTRQRLIVENVRPENLDRYGLSGVGLPPRNVPEIERAEAECLELAVRVAREPRKSRRRSRR